MLIYKPKSKRIPEEYLRSAYEKNQDGWGIMRRSRRGNPVISKGHGTFEEFMTSYKKNFEKYQCAIHFRYATQGDVCAEQAHPYEITKGVWLMHNGHMDVTITDKTKSDTWHFAKMLTDIVEAGWLRNPAVDHLLELAMQGTYNRLIVMDQEGIIIFNQGSGVVHNGVWYSNMSMWSPPADLVRRVYAKHATETNSTDMTATDTKTIEIASSEQEAYCAFWVNAIEKGMVAIDDAPPEIQEALDAAVSMAKDGDPSIMQAIEPSLRLITTEASQKQQTYLTAPEGNGSSLALQMEQETEVVVAPDTRQGWAELNRMDIRRLCYDDPDVVCDAFYDLMQG